MRLDMRRANREVHVWAAILIVVLTCMLFAILLKAQHSSMAKVNKIANEACWERRTMQEQHNELARFVERTVKLYKLDPPGGVTIIRVSTCVGPRPAPIAVEEPASATIDIP